MRTERGQSKDWVRTRQLLSKDKANVESNLNERQVRTARDLHSNSMRIGQYLVERELGKKWATAVRTEQDMGEACARSWRELGND